MTVLLLALATVRRRAEHRAALAAAGFDVHDVARPDGIANVLTRTPVGAMVIDVTRAFGGSALLHQLAADVGLPPRVLALTPPDDPAVVDAALAAGADEYLPVSTPADRVVATVHRLVGDPRRAQVEAPGPVDGGRRGD